MVDRIRKTLRQLSPKERVQIKEAMRKVIMNDLQGCDIKKLQGRDDVYRVRKGAIRIIFRKSSLGKENVIVAVERRSDTTYHLF